MERGKFLNVLVPHKPSQKVGATPGSDSENDEEEKDNDYEDDNDNEYDGR